MFREEKTELRDGEAFWDQQQWSHSHPHVDLKGEEQEGAMAGSGKD